VHDSKATRSAGRRRVFSGLRKRLRPQVLIFLLGKFVVGLGAFINSRRWLIGSLLISGLLLALVIYARPTPHQTFNSPGDPGITFDDVKSLPLGSAAAGSHFRPGVGEENRPADDALKAGGKSAGLALDPIAAEEGARSNMPRSLSRRLDAVRSRQARGAWLTGTIDKIAESPALPAAPANASSPQLIVPKQAARPSTDSLFQ
jgi:hypothetical protein